MFIPSRTWDTSRNSGLCLGGCPPIDCQRVHWYPISRTQDMRWADSPPSPALACEKRPKRGGARNYVEENNRDTRDEKMTTQMWRFRVGKKCGFPDEVICCNLVVRRVGSPVHAALPHGSHRVPQPPAQRHSFQRLSSQRRRSQCRRSQRPQVSATAALSDRSSQQPQLSATAALSDRSSQRPQLSATAALSRLSESTPQLSATAAPSDRSSQRPQLSATAALSAAALLVSTPQLSAPQLSSPQLSAP